MGIAEKEGKKRAKPVLAQKEELDAAGGLSMKHFVEDS